MNNQVQITVDGIKIEVPEGATILKAAQMAGIDIPTICYHDYCTANALCRICVVEVSGARTLIPSCIASVSDGMHISTSTPRINSSRKTILELMAASNDLSEAPEIMDLIDEYQVDTLRFPNTHKRDLPILDDNSMFIRDYAKCILCWRCVQVCAEDAQYAYAINFSNRGYHTSISTFYDHPLPETTCVFCGQCLGVCPTGALKPKRQWLLEIGYTPAEIMKMTRSERKSNTWNSSGISPVAVKKEE